MALDTSIPLQVRGPQFESPANALAQILQVRGAQQQEEMGRMKLAEFQRGVERQNRLSGLLGQSYATPEARESALMQGGFMDEALKYGKDRRENMKVEAEAQTKKLEAAHKRMDLMGQTLGWLRTNPSVENAQAAVKYLLDNGVMPPEKAQEAIAKFQADPTPQGIANFATMGYQAALSAKEQLPKFETRDTGATTDVLQIDPVSGKVVLAGQRRNTVSPNAQLQANVGMANAAATREIASATRDAARIKANQDTEMKLADDWRAQSKGFKEVADSYKTIQTSLDKATTSAAATLAGATKFMKLLDPGSVVRESELGMALAASGVLDRATNYLNTLQNGRVLTQKQAADFKNIAAQIYRAAQEGQKQVDVNYRRQAQQYGLRPEMIVQDLGQNASAPVDLGALPTGGASPGKPKVVDFGSLK